MPVNDGGLGAQLVGDKIAVNHRTVQVSKLLGEGGFSYVYLVKDIYDKEGVQPGQPDHQRSANGSTHGPASMKDKPNVMVLKVTSIHSRQQRDIAEKEAKLLSRLSHPSIIKMYDACYRTATDRQGLVANIVGANKDAQLAAGKDGRPQHMILMEYCEGGHALDVLNKLSAAGQRFDLSALIIAFGQICNAVSYLHAQRPPIVHRDLKPVNFLVKNGAYKLCDFGSAVFGHVELKTPKARAEAEEVIQKTTTQMFRAPEMLDLFLAKKLTQSTDVWALGCCLYSLAFLQNCFEEGSNLAILSRNYKIPDDNPYGEGLVELIDRMLTVDPKARSDMTEVILCLSAIYSGRQLPPRKKVSKAKKTQGEEEEEEEQKEDKVGQYRTDGQGIRKTRTDTKKKPAEAKKLNPNSAAARRRQAAMAGADSPGANSPKQSGQPVRFDASFSAFNAPAINEEMAFSTTTNLFAGSGMAEPSQDVFTFDGDGNAVASSGGAQGRTAFDAFDNDGTWGNSSSELEAGRSAPSGGFGGSFNGEGEVGDIVPPMDVMQLGEDGEPKKTTSGRRKSAKKEKKGGKEDP